MTLLGQLENLNMNSKLENLNMNSKLDISIKMLHLLILVNVPWLFYVKESPPSSEIHTEVFIDEGTLCLQFYSQMSRGKSIE